MLVMANAISIQQTDINIKGITNALGEVKETAEKALRLASQALPSLTLHRVKLDRLEDDVSRLHAELDGLTSPPDHKPQIDLLERRMFRELMLLLRSFALKSGQLRMLRLHQR